MPAAGLLPALAPVTHRVAGALAGKNLGSVPCCDRVWSCRGVQHSDDGSAVQ